MSEKTERKEAKLVYGSLVYGDDYLPYSSYIHYDSEHNMFYVNHRQENTHWTSEVTPDELRAFADFIENYKPEK